MPRGEGKGAPLPPLKRDTMIVIAFSFFSHSLSLSSSIEEVRASAYEAHVYVCMYDRSTQCNAPHSLSFSLAAKLAFNN